MSSHSLFVAAGPPVTFVSLNVPALSPACRQPVRVRLLPAFVLFFAGVAALVAIAIPQTKAATPMIVRFMVVLLDCSSSVLPFPGDMLRQATRRAPPCAATTSAADATRIHLTLESGPRPILAMRRMKDREWTIGAFANACGVSRDTVRFYERAGLLPKARRTASRYRVYGDGDEARLQFIRRAQGLGLTLEDIRGLLRQHEARTPDECRRVATLLRERIQALDRKLAELRAFRKVLAENLARCEAAHSEECPVVVDLSRSRAREDQR